MRRTALVRALVLGVMVSLQASALLGLSQTAEAAAPVSVATTTMTFVDSSRPTPAWDGAPAKPNRTLVTSVWYPSAGPGPYPLIVFAHGLGASPQVYGQLLEDWAAAGYVVAAPLFPLSNGATAGGPDAGDVANQPADMSFVIGQILKASRTAHDPLSGLVNPKEVGAAGHSNGAITTLGLVANSCCRDTRVKAAVVMAGTTEGLGRGAYHLISAPPLLLVHDIRDGLIPYNDALALYNEARGPKGLIALSWDTPSDPTGGTAHMAASGVVGPTSNVVVQSTTAFFNAFLKHEHSELQAVLDDGRSPLSSVYTAWKPGSRLTLTVPTTAPLHLHATVTPDTGLTNGQPVTVRWSGYTAGKVVNILECSHVDVSTASSAGCSFAHAAILHPDPTGSGSAVINVGTGAIGNGVCDAAHSCFIVVNNASATDAADTKAIRIRFAP